MMRVPLISLLSLCFHITMILTAYLSGEVFSSKSYETIFLVESSGDGNKEHGKPICEASLPQPEIGICVSAMSKLTHLCFFHFFSFLLSACFYFPILVVLKRFLSDSPISFHHCNASRVW